MFNRRLSFNTSFAPCLCKSLYRLPLKSKCETHKRLEHAKWAIITTINNFQIDIYLDKYSVTMDKFGASVTAPISSTIFGWRNLFMIATLTNERS